MLKGTGILLILLGSTGLGLTMAGELEKRIEELQTLQQLMLLLRSEIRYMHQPLPEAFLRMGREAPEPFGDFFMRTAAALQKRDGQTAGRIWTENLGILLPRLHLERHEVQELRELGNMLGYLDVEMQLNVLDYYLEKLKNSTEQARETAKSRKKVYRYLGVLGGAALVLFII